MFRQALILATYALYIGGAALAQSAPSTDATTTKPADTLLVCQVQTDNIGEFLRSIEHDPLIDCTFNTILHNQFCCPLSDDSRHRRWKRLLRNELLWTKKESINRAEFLAAACGIPLR
jgi:hypothetical protein